MPHILSEVCMINSTFSPKKQERLSYSSVTNILCHLFIGLCTEPLPLRKNRRRKKGGSVLGSITSRCSARGIKDRTLETAEIEPRSVHRLSFYIPHKQLNLNITGKNVKFCFVSILFLYYQVVYVQIQASTLTTIECNYPYLNYF